jgi:hypothetical protein
MRFPTQSAPVRRRSGLGPVGAGVTPSGCDVFKAIACGGALIACGAVCVGSIGAACAQCLAGIGAAGCIDCV